MQSSKVLQMPNTLKLTLALSYFTASVNEPLSHLGQEILLSKLCGNLA
jgi:hypothetical protein